MSDEERRKFDESVRFKLIEGQARIEALVGSTNDQVNSLRKDIAEHSTAIAEIRYAMFGGPKESDVGLIEKHRRLQKNWTIIISLCALIFSAVGKSLAPYLGKLVTDYIYNSPSEKWRKEQMRPKIRKYVIQEPPSDSP